ncbi:MAG: carboxylating nicotinate-nucleotide diphosphorylase [Methanomassiliicoccales archaeon]|nr:carboxylating nicotinate-nucleotide diphosphorylase [Methanomassiliicoccales archaeon]
MDLIDLYLQEDLGEGDITSQALVDDREGRAAIAAGQDGTLAGLEEAVEVFRRTGCQCRQLAKDGEAVKEGQVVLEISGPLKGILAGERLALNFIMRMSGVATLTRQVVGSCKKANPNVVVAATRKTTPGFRRFEKKAVRLGGGDPHRFGLDDAFLIKDNHLTIVGSVFQAVKKARSHSFGKKVEIEVESLEQAQEAARASADIIMLDNMTPSQAKECYLAVKAIDQKILVEVSGGITLKSAKDYAHYADVISMGALTHSAPAVHFSLHIVSDQ